MNRITRTIGIIVVTTASALRRMSSTEKGTLVGAGTAPLPKHHLRRQPDRHRRRRSCRRHHRHEGRRAQGRPPPLKSGSTTKRPAKPRAFFLSQPAQAP